MGKKRLTVGQLWRVFAKDADMQDVQWDFKIVGKEQGRKGENFWVGIVFKDGFAGHISNVFDDNGDSMEAGIEYYLARKIK